MGLQFRAKRLYVARFNSAIRRLTHSLPVYVVSLTVLSVQEEMYGLLCATGRSEGEETVVAY
jgi:hypothetical protein